MHYMNRNLVYNDLCDDYYDVHVCQTVFIRKFTD